MARNEDFIKRVRGAMEPIPHVSVAVLFGSRATGRARLQSDLDIAVLLAAGDVPRRELQSEIAVALADLAPEGRVDVVFIDEAPELLRQRIMETGIVLLSRDEASWREWRVRTMREHGDREPVRRLLRRRQKERLLGGLSRGGSGRALESLERVGNLPR